MAAAFVTALALMAGPLGATSDLTYVATVSDGLVYPARLASTPGGGVYVTDPPSGLVIEYDAAMAFVTDYSIPEGPVGIAVHTDGRVFVSREDGVIGVYDSTFTLLGAVDPAPMTLTGPNDLAFDPVTEEMYTVDGESHSVLVFSESAPDVWTLARSWGMEGSGLGEFAAPQAIALDGVLGHVIVTDADNFRIQVFDTAGTTLFKFGYRILYTADNETAWFARSEGLDVDVCGNIYVADALMGTLRVFDATGTELDVLNAPALGFGSGAGQLNLPCDVLIDAAGSLYIANTNNGAVEVFDVDCALAAAASAPARSIEKPFRGQRGLMAALEKGRLMTGPDSPLDVMAAIESGEYDADLDLDYNRQIDETDLHHAIDMFGIGSVEDFENLASHPAVAAPHILDMPNRCGRCHDMDGSPGGMLTSSGQMNLCLSCHSAGKIAGELSIGGGHLENSHPWGVPAPPLDPDSELADHLDMGNIRCGTCHNPHENANGQNFVRSKLYSTTVVETGQGPTDMIHFNPSLCSECHTEIVDQWHEAGHADEGADPWTHYNWSLASRAACRQCHTGSGYIDLSKGKTQLDGTLRVVDCLVCHTTHGAPQSETLLRIYGEATVPTVGPDETLTGLGVMATCYTCHNGRRAPDDGDLTPHYALGGVMFEGINANDFGFTLVSSQHQVLADAGLMTCASCHMAASPASGDPGAGKVGGHTFNLVVHDSGDPDFGFENATNACGTCHSGLTTINRLANGDYDGDGTVEGIQDEVEELMTLVFTEIQVKNAVFLGNYPYWDLSGVDPADLSTVRQAIWNWEFVDNSGDRGVKNTAYAVGALQVAYRALVGVDVPGAALRYFP